MSLRVRRPYVYMLIVSILLGGMIFFVRQSELFALDGVEFRSSMPVPDSLLFQEAVGSNLFDIRFEQYADSLLHHRQVLKVDIDYRLPDKIRVRLNDSDPVAVVLTEGKLCAINWEGYFVPYESDSKGLFYPIITGFDKVCMYDAIDDDRLELVVENLKKLIKENRDFYEALANIDVSDSELISVYVEGVKPELIMYPGGLAENVNTIEAFLSDYDPDLSLVKRLDLRSEGLIIAVNE